MPQSGIPADDDCTKLARACTGAARELAAARRLIVALKDLVGSADERIRIAERQIEALKETRTLETQRAVELQAVITAEREAKDALLGKIELQEKRIKQLEGQAKRRRKLALITATAAAVGILVAIAK